MIWCLYCGLVDEGAEPLECCGDLFCSHACQLRHRDEEGGARLLSECVEVEAAA